MAQYNNNKEKTYITSTAEEYNNIQSSLYEIDNWTYRPTQCTHFTDIYVVDHYDISTKGYGNGKDVAHNLATRNTDTFTELSLNSKSSQNTINQIKPGSVFSTPGGEYGHTGIVEKVIRDDNGNVTGIITSEANVDYKGGFRFWYERDINSFIKRSPTIANPIEQLPTKQEYIQSRIDEAYQSVLNYHR